MKISSTTPSEIIKLAGWIQFSHKQNYHGEGLDFDDDEYACAVDEEGYGFCMEGAIIQAQCNEYLYSTTIKEDENGESITHADMMAWNEPHSWDNAHEGLKNWMDQKIPKHIEQYKTLAQHILEKATKEQDTRTIEKYWEIAREVNRTYKHPDIGIEGEVQKQMIEEATARRFITAWNDDPERNHREIVEALEAVGL